MTMVEELRAEELPLLRHMPEGVRQLVAESFTPVSFGFGDVIVTEGQELDGLYVVSAGQARVVATTEDGSEVAVATLGPGDSFGERENLEQTPAACTVRASGPLTMLRLHQTVLRALTATNPEIRRSLELQGRESSLRRFFRTYSAFAQLPDEDVTELLKAAQPVTLTRGDVIIRQGDPPGPMYVVEQGRLRAQRDGRDIGYLRMGDVFGEASVFTGLPRSASIQAVDDCRLLRFDADAFEQLLGDHPSFRAEIGEQVEQRNYKQVARVPLDFADEILPADAQIPGPPSREEAERQPVDVAPEPETAPGVAGPFATDDGRFVKGPKRIRRFPHIWQIDEMDCGAASTAMVCRHFGRAVSLPKVRQAVGTGIDGTSLKGITRGAERLGLATRSVKASKRNLDQMPLPAIVHWDANHWLIVYDVRPDTVRLADPALGIRRIKRSEFEERWSGYAALFEPTPAFDETPVEKGFQWLWGFFRPWRRSLGAASLLALGVSALQMVLPLFIQVVVDRVLPARDFDLLRVLLLSIAAVALVMLFGGLAQRYILSRLTVKVDASTFDHIAQRMLALPMTYFYARRTGDIQRRMAGMQQIRQLVVQNGVVALTAVTQLVTALVLMFIVSWVLALVFLAGVPVYVVLMRMVSKRLRPVFDTLEEAFGRYNSRQIDAIKGIEAVKAMGAEEALRRQLLTEFQGLTDRLFRADFTAMCFEGAVQLVSFASLAVFLWIGSLQVLSGDLSIGGLVSFNALVVLANSPIGILLALWDQLQFASVLLTRVSDVMSEEPEQGRDHSGLAAVPSLEGHVGVHGLGFRYGGPDSPSILADITFDVPAGTRVAIVGRSGSGKTTFVKCLAGLLEPTEGRITYDRVDMRSLRFRDLRRHIGFVLQDNFLFADTIARNIAFGEDQPDMERVEWAARLANAHDFIARLPLGYGTRVGETGLLLSGGQRQRIAIARAAYHRPPILIFDEATSALDTESEKAVQDNLGRLLEGRTSFVIAHRLSTIRDADVILVLEKGRLVERGSHEQLMAQKGLYFYLCSQQLSL